MEYADFYDIMIELVKLLKEDGTEECLEWKEMITREINGCI